MKPIIEVKGLSRSHKTDHAELAVVRKES